MKWIAAVQPLVSALGSNMASGLAAVYRVDWPAAPVVVDASFEAGADGGYTTDGPVSTAAHDLWHAIIFYTTGELARRELQKNSHANYVPYAYRNGLWNRGWQSLREALERDWQPYLDGHAKFDSAMQALVEDTSQRQ